MTPPPAGSSAPTTTKATRVPASAWWSSRRCARRCPAIRSTPWPANSATRSWRSPTPACGCRRRVRDARSLPRLPQRRAHVRVPGRGGGGRAHAGAAAWLRRARGYEAVLTLVYRAIYRVGQSRRARNAAVAGKAVVRRWERLNGSRGPPPGAGLSAMAEVVGRLGIDADYVLFGHLHRPGSWHLARGATLFNTGCSVDAGSRSGRAPYVFAREKGAPEVRHAPLIRPGIARIRCELRVLGEPRSRTRGTCHVNVV